MNLDFDCDSTKIISQFHPRYKNMEQINNHFGGKLCWNCHRTFDFWGAKGKKVRVNEENSPMVTITIMETFLGRYVHYGS